MKEGNFYKSCTVIYIYLFFSKNRILNDKESLMIQGWPMVHNTGGLLWWHICGDHRRCFGNSNDILDLRSVQFPQWCWVHARFKTGILLETLLGCDRTVIDDLHFDLYDRHLRITHLRRRTISGLCLWSAKCSLFLVFSTFNLK